MSINSQIDRDEWPDFFVTFSNGNRGRTITLEVFDSETGDSPTANQGTLMAVDFDPVGKGNDIVITTGTEAIDYSHTIEAPVAVWRAQDDNGQIASLEIVDQNNVKTILAFSGR